MNPLRLLTSRALAACLMVALVAALLLLLAAQGAVPGVSASPADPAGSTGWTPPQPLASVLALALAAAVVIAIGAATAVQARVAWRRTFGATAAPGTPGRRMDADPDALARTLRSAGWVGMRCSDARASRLVRNPWSLWAGVALHIGLVLIVLASAATILTGRRMTVHAKVGETVSGRTEPTAEVHGTLAAQLTLPGELEVTGVAPEYAPGGDLSQIRTELASAAEGRRMTVAVNDVLSWRRIRVYQSQEFGPAYAVRFSRDGAEIGDETIEMLASSPAGSPTYRDIVLPWGPELLRVRSVTEESGGKASMRLTLRLEHNGEVLAEEPLEPGKSVALGPYTAELQSVTWWTRLIFVEEHGIPLLFAGFLLAGVAAVLLYAAPVREVIVLRYPNRAEIIYRAPRFPGAADERARLWRMADVREEGE